MTEDKVCAIISSMDVGKGPGFDDVSGGFAEVLRAEHITVFV